MIGDLAPQIQRVAPRRLASALRLVVASLALFAIVRPALAAERLSTPKRYEECLIANGALFETASGDGKIEYSVEAAYKHECLYIGQSREAVETKSIENAVKALPIVLHDLYLIKDKDFIKHAECVANNAKSWIISQSPNVSRGYADVLTASRRAARICPDLSPLHKRDKWEVITVAQMLLAQQDEADSDAQFYGYSGVERTHSRAVTSGDPDPFTHDDSKMVFFTPKNRREQQVGIGAKCFSDGRVAIFISVLGYDKYKKSNDGYEIRLKINEGDIIEFHAYDTPDNMSVWATQSDSPAVPTAAKELLNARKIAIYFRDEGFLIYPDLPGLEDKKMLHFCRLD